MAQEHATASGTGGALPAARPTQVQVVVNPPVVDVERRNAREAPPQGDRATGGSADRRPAELARGTASYASNRRFGRIWYVPTGAIHPAPVQLRKHLSPDELQSLARSLREKGMTQPVLLRCRRGTADEFELIAGYRRWRAAILAGMAEIPAIVIDRVGEREALELALVENLQRRDLSVLEEAEAFRIMIESYGQTHEQVAAVAGRSRSHVSNMLRLLGLPAEVKAMIESGRISFGHARALLAASSPAELAARVAEERLTVRETERIVGTTEGAILPAAPPAAADPDGSRPDGPGPAGDRDDGPAGEPDATADELTALQAEIAQQLGAIVEIKLEGRRPAIRIHTRSTAEAAATARTIRDALQLLNMSRAMRHLSGVGRTG